MSSNCPLCKRPLTITSVSRHHLVPKTFGGKDLVDLHKMCHQKLHATFTEREMKNYYHTIERIMENEDMQNFVVWIKNKDPDFYSSNNETQARKGKRRR